jgi:hypothetical protein
MLTAVCAIYPQNCFITRCDRQPNAASRDGILYMLWLITEYLSVSKNGA